MAHIDVTLSYNDADQVASISRYLDDVLTVTADYTYDSSGLLVGLVYHQGDMVLTQYTFSGVAWDATAAVSPLLPGEGQGVRAGQSMLPAHETSEIAEAIAGSSSSSNLLTTVTSSDGTVTYTYDAIGQLLSATYSNESIADETYTYDANGNRTSATGSASVVGADNQLQSDGTYRYSYDAEGNRIAKFIDTDADGLLDEGDTSITQYIWDARNRLMEVTSYATYGGSASQVVDYYYDAENRWIAETIDSDGDGQIDRTLGFVYDGDQVVLQFERAGESATGSASALTDSDLSHRYLWQANAVDQLLADEQLLSATGSASGGEGGSDGYDLSAPGDVLFALTDQLGTVRDLATYDNGITSIANHRIYDSFGDLTSETNAAVDCLFGFTGRAYDESSGLQNNLNRWYDSKVGRWASEDPIGFDGLDANQYRYVVNSPTNATDPTGCIRNFDFNPNGPRSPSFEKKKHMKWHTKDIWANSAEYRFFAFYNRQFPSMFPSDVPDVVILDGDFLTDVLGQSELVQYISDVEKIIKLRANYVGMKLAVGETATFTDRGSGGICADLLSVNVRLTLQRFTVYWEAQGTVGPKNADGSAYFKGTIKWTIYDKYDFCAWEIYAWLGEPFYILGSWNQSFAGTIHTATE